VNRPADQEALRQVAITAAQKLELRNGFHAPGGHFNIEATRHGNGGTYDSLVAAIEFNVLYQGLVKNEAVDNPGIQLAERNISCAEVIERQANAKCTHAVQCFKFRRPLANDMAIADFKFNTARIKRGVLKSLCYRFNNPALPELLLR